MKRKISIVLAVILAFVLVSCQHTPKSPIVVGKDTGKVIEKATSENNGKSLTEMLKAPDTYKASLTTKNNDVKANVNMKVTIPDVEKIPTLSVQKREFSQKEINSLRKILLGEKNIYSAESAFAMTKAEIQEKIVKLRQKLKGAKGSDKDMIDSTIAKYEKVYETAPETVDKTPISTDIIKDGKKREVVKGITDGEDGKHGYFEVVNSPKYNAYRVFYSSEPNGYSTAECFRLYEWDKNVMYKSGIDSKTLQKMPTLSITREQAQKLAKDFIHSLGIDYLTCYSIEKAIGCVNLQNGTQPTATYNGYSLEFVRTVNGVPVVYTDNKINRTTLLSYTGDSVDTPKDAENNPEYTAPWPYERMSFMIDDSGIREFVWESPYKITKTVTQNTTVLPFSDISKVFDSMILITKAGKTGNQSVVFDISKANLGLMRITEKNNNDTALLIPVWDFFGSLTYIADKDQDGSSTPEVDNDLICSRLTINAIDGSIIDRSVTGY